MGGKKIKAAVAVCGLAMTAAAGLYLSGYLTITLLKVDAPLAWNTYWLYVQALHLPQVAPYAKQIKLGGAIGFGLPLLAYVLLLVPLFRPASRSLHGRVRFASGGDLAR
jgi:type IV secretion system protein VirD4